VIYLDHAATSFPKPPEVLDAVRRWFSEVGVSADRGDGPHCQDARVEVAAARSLVADLVGTKSGLVAFHSGATESLNLVLRALLRPGDGVVATAFEHSSVARPLVTLQKERDLRLHVIPPDADGALSVDAVVTALAMHRPAVFVFPHASNVTGACFDAAAFCDVARRAGVVTVLDACQTAGLFDLRVGADFVVASGHKALLGPPGIGFVASRERELSPQKQGGTGSSAALAEHPTRWPYAFEAGTPNTPAIFGLAAALRYRDAVARSAALAASVANTVALAEALVRLPGVSLVAPTGHARAPVLSFVHADFDPAEIGAMLAAADIHVRTGFHCAPWLHRHLGTELAGTVRVSPGPDLSPAEIAAVAAAIG